MLDEARDTERAELLISLIRERPTKRAMKQWVGDRSPLATSDYRVWEAAARYASARSFNDISADLWERAATLSPDPDRHRTRQALSLYIAGDSDGARQELASLEGSTVLSRLIALTVDDDPDAVAEVYDHELSGDLDPVDVDDRTTGQLVVQALVQVGRFDDAPEPERPTSTWRCSWLPRPATVFTTGAYPPSRPHTSSPRRQDEPRWVP